MKKEDYPMERKVPLGDARHRLDWGEQFRFALYGDHAKKIHEHDGETETYPVCGDLQ